MLDNFTPVARRRYIGSSDSAALCGQDPWGRTAGDVWAQKTGRVPRTPSTMAMTVGTYLEPAILAWLEHELATPITRDLFLVHHGGNLCAQIDGAALTALPPVLVEAKTVGLLGRPDYLADFGEPGTDEVPTHTLIQVQHQLAVAEGHPEVPPITGALVPALLSGRGFVVYRIEKHQALCDALVEEGERFWRDHVLTDIPPPEAPSLQTLRHLKRTPELGVPIDPKLVDLWLTLKEGTKAAHEIEDGALQALLASLGDFEVGTCDLGTFTYKAQSRKAYEVAAATFRVPRFKPAREGSR